MPSAAGFSPMTTSYIPLFLQLAAAAVLALGMFTATSILGPKNPTPEKLIPYESGSESTGARHVRLSVKFYLTAILFTVFDVEAVFLYPWAVRFRQLGTTGFLSMLAFLAVLTLGLAYAWKKGALEWEK